MQPISISKSYPCPYPYHLSLDQVMSAVCFLLVEAGSCSLLYTAPLNRNTLQSKPSGPTQLSHHTVELHTFDGSTGHRGANVALEALPIRPQIIRSFFVQRIRSIRLEEEELHSNPKVSPANYTQRHRPSLKPTCMPTITAFKFRTGFQSSRKMFRHTFPSRSIFGW